MINEYGNQFHFLDPNSFRNLLVHPSLSISGLAPSLQGLRRLRQTRSSYSFSLTLWVPCQES